MTFKLDSIVSKRMTIRKPETHDWQFFYDMQSNVDLMEHVKEIPTLNEIKEIFNAIIAPWNSKDGEWTSMIGVDKDTLEPIACLSVRIVNNHSLCAEIGYMVPQKFQNQGYASEGANAIKHYLFNVLHMRRVCAFCNATNVSSWKVMEKIGLIREGHLKQEYRINDVWHDTFIYGLVNTSSI